jgi:hypothetical protein
MKKSLLYILIAITVLSLPVSVKAGTKSISSLNSSQLYPLWFPGTLNYIRVTGTTDRRTYSSEKITYGIDYVVLKYNYPRFNYVDSTELKSGCYLVQFVDNFNGLTAALWFGTDADSTMETPTAEKPYVLVGNTSSNPITPEGKFLKYSTTDYKFLATSGETVSAYEAYITTNVSNPVSQIVVSDGGITNGIRRIYGTDGTRLSICTSSGGVTIYSAAKTLLTIYSVNGQTAKTVELTEGPNTIRLPRGLYIADGKKFIVK